MTKKFDPAEYRRRWGIPDWRDATAYPRRLPDPIWRWEFLRRREDYRKDYQTFHAKTVEWYRKHTFEDFQKGKSPAGDGVIYPENWDEHKDQNFTVQMPKSLEKYGMPFLPDPAIDRPRRLIFDDGPYAISPPAFNLNDKRTRGVISVLTICPRAPLDLHVRMLKSLWVLHRRLLKLSTTRNHRVLYSRYLRALDAESEHTPYSEIAAVLDPRSRRPRARGEELVAAAHTIQELLTRPI